jgi:hypothetical protein
MLREDGAEARTQIYGSALPRVIRYNGNAAENSGSVVVTFAIYGDNGNSAPLWSETQTLTLANGTFSALLGSTSSEGLPAEIFSGEQARWLSVSVNGSSAQRSLLVSVPYAMKALEAERLAGRNAQDYVSTDQLEAAIKRVVSAERLSKASGPETSAAPGADSSATDFTDTNGTEVLLVTQNGGGYAINAIAAAHIAVRGVTTAVGVGAVQGENAAAGGFGVHGISSSPTGASSGVFGLSVSDVGRGVRGVNTSAVGATVGVQGQVFSPDGAAVQGDNSATTGIALGVRGVTNSSAGKALAGLALASTGASTAIDGQNASNAGTAIFANATSTTGNTFGLLARVNSPNGTAARFESTSSAASATLFSGISANVQRFIVRGTGHLITTNVFADGIAIEGNSTLTGNHFGYGVVGATKSNLGAGVIGTTTAAGNALSSGVQGYVTGTAGVGVWGEATNNAGGSTPIGVYGVVNNATAIGGVFENKNGGGLIARFLSNGTQVAAIDANGFSGSGANLTNIPGGAIIGAIAGNAATATTADNALSLGGILAANYAQIAYVDAADVLLQSNIDAEAAARAAADTTLQGNIDGEAAARTAADSTLQGNIDAEAAARSAADTNLQANIDAEATARVAADTTLQNNIDAEATARATADTALQNNIDAEATARAAADTSLQGNITAEAVARAAADTNVQNNIDAEALARIAGDAAAAQLAGNNVFSGSNDFSVASATSPLRVVNSLPAACAGGKEMVILSTDPAGMQVYICNADDVSWSLVGDGAPGAATAGDITAEAAVRAAADTTLQSNIDAEAASRAAADGTLQNNIDAEATARANADTSLQANIDAEAAARAAADAALQTNIDSEAAARIAADTTLQSNIDAEAVARTAADTTLQSNIDAEATARASADTALQDNIDAEAVARIAGDAATLASANTYTDTQVSAEATARIAGDTAALASANTYTDGQIATEVAARIAGDANSAKTNLSNTFAADQKQTFTAGVTNAGINLAGVVVDPSALANGDVWFRSDAGNLLVQVGGATKTLAFTDSALMGNAATATALAANGTNCAAGQYALGVDALGNAEGCSSDGSSFTGLNPANIANGLADINISGNAATADTATTAGSATNFTGVLAGDVTGNQTTTVVANVGGQSAANVASATTLANAATDANTANAIVRRDASGNFTAGTITANLAGNATSATSATNFSGALAGDVTGNQGTTTVASVGGQSAANVSAGVSLANAATDANSANAIVRRDASGNFTAGTITANLIGNVSGNVSTATALAANGANCAGNNFALGVDAAGVAECAQPAFSNLSGTATVGQGGTGATDAASARANLAAAGSGANSDITSLSGLTTALSAGQGGTGITSSGAAGNYLRSNGTTWTAATIQAADLPNLSGTFVDLTTNQSIAGTKTFTGSINATGATATLPIRATTTPPTGPGACTANMELIIDTDEPPGRQLFICNSAGTGFQLLGDGLGSSGVTFNQVSIGIDAMTLDKNTCSAPYTGTYPTPVADQDLPIPPVSGQLTSTSTLVVSPVSPLTNQMPSGWTSYTYYTYVDSTPSGSGGPRAFLHVCNPTQNNVGASGAITFNVRALN